jgi:peroxidase
MFWQWGQFIDHDMDLTEGADPPEPFPIQIPTGDSFFDPYSTGTAIISMNRSAYDRATGATPNNPRQQMNFITAYLDASMVYGSDAIRAAALRTNDGTGRLKTSAGQLLPFNTDGLPNAGGPDPNFFVAGDVRANEQVGLTAMHTLFVREHNRLIEIIHRRHPGLGGDEIY